MTTAIANTPSRAVTAGDKPVGSVENGAAAWYDPNPKPATARTTDDVARRDDGRHGNRPARALRRPTSRSYQPMTAGKKILLVDDDDALRDSLSEQLQLREEFVIAEAADGGRALDAARDEYFDVILLDVGLPDMDGREVCRLLRRNGVKSPIIMLTGRGLRCRYQILGLDAGANDYVTKPFRLGVLLARLRAQLRQHEQSEDAIFTIGPYTFRPSEQDADTIGETRKKVRLTEKETAILKYLYRSRPSRWSRRDTLAWRGLGLQRRRDHAHAGNACLPAAPENGA